MNWNPFKKSATRYGGMGQSVDNGDDFITGGTSNRSYSIPYLALKENDARNSSIVQSIAWWAMRNVIQARPCVESEVEGGGERDFGHPCAVLLKKPQALINEEDRSRLGYRKLIRGWCWSLMFDGNAYAHKIRNSRGALIGLDWLPHTAVEPIERPGLPQIIDGYRIGANVVSAQDVFHCTIGIDDVYPARGCSPLKHLMRMVLTDNQISVFSHAILRNPFPGLIVTPSRDDQVFRGEDVEFLLAQLANATSGERGGGVAGFTQKIAVEKIGYSPDDMAISELAKLPEERICAVFGIPPMVLQLGAGLERSTMANMRQAYEAAHENFLVPLWEDIADAIDGQLLPEYAPKPNQKFLLDYSAVKALQEDTDSLNARARENFKANLITRARAKQMIGETPEKGDDVTYYHMLAGPASPTAAQKGIYQAARNAKRPS